MTKDASRPGPVFDRVMRVLVEHDLEAFCVLAGVRPDSNPELLSSTFPAETRSADLLARVGPDRLLHAEYMRKPTPDVAVRMIAYRAAIMRRYPGERLTQIAVVLGEGELQLADDPQNGFSLGLHVLYVRDADPDLLLSHPDLAPLATLTRGTDDERGTRFTSALTLIAEQPEGRRAALIEATMKLSAITLNRSTIEQQIRKGMGMSLDEFEEVVEFWGGTEFGQKLRRRAHDEGEQEGRLEARSRLLAALLRNRFGDRPELSGLADELARSEASEDTLIAAISSAAGPEELRPTRG